LNTASSRDRIMNIVSGQLADIVTDDHTIEENGGLLWNLRIASAAIGQESSRKAELGAWKADSRKRDRF
jgi:hypothetical protein